MTSAVTLTFAAAAAVLVYVYVGYPALLWLIVRVRGARPVRRADIAPAVSLVISAFNEAAVIRKKIENALALSYPRELLEVVVISDASDDGTDEIVSEYASQGVRLLRQTERRGKTEGLNRAVPHLTGDVFVFSDANAMYQPDALRKLVRNFADPAVGCVTGEARYLTGEQNTADVSERAYWDYEIQIKRLETALGSMVGGDGAIYAIRRGLWSPLPQNAINDFLNPLQIVAAGYRAVYEPEAVCYEETAGAMGSEYRRRVRIVSRSWRAVFQAGGVLNPIRVGAFTWSLVSHKMLRWLSAPFAVVAAATGAVLLWRLAASAPQAVAAALGIVLLLSTGTAAGRRLQSMAFYFTVINAASLVGVIKGSLGNVSGVWSTPRQVEGPAPRGSEVPVGRLLQAAGVLLIAAAAFALYRRPPAEVAFVAFWGSVAMLAYVYAGYPVVLFLLRRVAARPVQAAPIEPTVTIFITANDEAGVMEAKLQNTLAIDYPADRLSVVVGSDGSVDATNEIVRRFAPRVRLLDYPLRRGKMATINDGMRSVSSEIVVFSDANTFLDPGAVRALVANFADAQVGAVSADVTLVGERAALGRSEDIYYRYERWVQRVESEIGSMIGADGALYAIRRELFTFPANDTILDDMAIPMAVVRAGRRVVFEGTARAYEQGSETAREEFSRKTRVVAGAMQFLRRPDSAVPVATPQVVMSLVSHKVLRWLSPAFATAAFVSSAALADASHAYAAAVVAQLLLVGLGVLGCAPALRRIGVIALAHYFCLIQAAAALGFVRGIVGQQSVLWQRFARVQTAAPATLTK